VVRAKRAGEREQDGLLEAKMTTARRTLLILCGVAGTLLAVLMLLFFYLRATFRP